MRLLVDIVEPEHQKEAYTEMVRAKRIDGILLSGPRYDDEALKVLGREGFPTVLIGQLPGPTFYSVDVDNISAAKTVTEHLLRLGHTKIACITNAREHFTAASDRLEGYRQALSKFKIPFEKSLIRYGDFDADSGFQQMKNLLENDCVFTAAFVASDSVALGAIAAIRERGLKIPQDIAIVGFDDIPIAKFLNPPLTTVHLPAIELGKRAGVLLINLLKNDRFEHQHVILGTDLVIRESCGSNNAK
jgi:LacI family transcriptional regulator